jgi:methyl-accepting chemotaxis protein
MNIGDALKGRLAKPGDLIKDLLFTGVGGVSLTMIYQFFELMKGHPELLLKWGPNFMLVLLAITVVGVLANRVVDALSSGIDRMSEATQSSAEANVKTSESMAVMAGSLKDVAEQGGQQMREIQVQVGYAVQQTNLIMQRLTAQDDALNHLRELCKSKATEPQETERAA